MSDVSPPEPSVRRSAAARLLFWCAAALLVALKLALISDLSVQIVYGPLDDGLYVDRALRLLDGQGFGPYDSHILSKLPGFSFWLAGTRLLGLPYLFTVNVIYIAAGLYFAAGMLAARAHRGIVLAALALYLFNPVTFGSEWIRVLREPLGTGFLVLQCAALLHIYVAIDQRRMPLWHILAFSLVFGFALLVREDDRLLWGLLALALAGALWRARRHFPKALAPIALLAAVSTGCALGFDALARSFVERHYGLPIIYELGEGEYPRMLAAARSVASARYNRLAMVTQESLSKLKAEVPLLSKAIERLPQPGYGTESCRIYGVCSEIAFGWMPFFLKDAAFDAGLTPSLPQGQQYFQAVRLQIEQACREKRLDCLDRGQGPVPTMQLQWTRALVKEWVLHARMAILPEPYLVEEPGVVFANVPVPAGRRFQAVTMTDYFDSKLQEGIGDRPGSRPYANPLAGWRAALVRPLQLVAAALLFLSAMAAALWAFSTRRMVCSPLAAVGIVVVAYSVLRVTALAYVALFFGSFFSRLMFSIYSVMLLASLPLIAETALEWLRARGAKEP
ncbi:MAG: hypothetical protein A3H27_03770 [Acidobacteria bacterium RIFCSPLOWO2_02_FULL_59_13]|nr:MAG: hypothetical protein A3H27_03770 [Acidobacteria bacterium RIFCSPLOWO2_02_FULL_59_13]